MNSLGVVTRKPKPLSSNVSRYAIANQTTSASRRANSLFLHYLLCISFSALGSSMAEEVIIHSFENLEGVTARPWGPVTVEQAANQDKKFLSHGESSLYMSSATTDKPGKYASLAIMLKEPVDLKNREFLFDAWTKTPESTQALYVRMYDSKGGCAASWSNWSSPFRKRQGTFSITPKLSVGRFIWEPKKITEGARPEAVTRIEFIIGCKDPNTKFDLFLDYLRYRPERKKVVSLTELKEATARIAETSLNETVVVVPGDFPDTVKQKLVRALKAAGSAVQILDAEKELPVGRSAILAGRLDTNPHVAWLYNYGYTPVDVHYPGGDGWLVKTVHDPWATGRNAIVLGGSSLKGVERAIDVFCTRLPKHIRKDGGRVLLKSMWDFELGDEAQRTIGRLMQEPKGDYAATQVKVVRAALVRGVHTGATNYLARYGQYYALTGKPWYAKAFVAVTDLMYEHYLSKPTTYGGPWGMDSDFTVYRVFPGWDVVEECPAITDEERLRVTQILGKWVKEACAPKARSVRGNRRVRFNHQTFPALGLHFAGTYFSKYYHLAEARVWLATAKECFQVQADAFKVYEDCNSYQWLTNYHLFRYAMAARDDTFLKNGNAKRIADYCIHNMDNLGFQVPYGDTGSWQCSSSDLPFLRAAAHVTRDGRYQWALQKKLVKRSSAPWFSFGSGIEATPPEDSVGVFALPVDPMYFETFKGSSHVSYGSAVDKVIMRSGLDEQDDYLLLDGLSGGGHGHYDAQTISRITSRGRIWLADNDYIRSLPKFHNGLQLFRNGQSRKMAISCEFAGVARGEGVQYASTSLRDGADAHWQRHLFHFEGIGFLVIDQARSLNSGERMLHQLWHVVGEVSKTDSGFDVVQTGEKMRLRTLNGLQLKTEVDEHLSGNWSHYPHAEPRVTRLSVIHRASTNIRQKDLREIPMLLHFSSAEDQRAASIEKADDQPGSYRVRAFDREIEVHIGQDEVVVAMEERELRLRQARAASWEQPEETLWKRRLPKKRHRWSSGEMVASTTSTEPLKPIWTHTFRPPEVLVSRNGRQPAFTIKTDTPPLAHNVFRSDEKPQQLEAVFDGVHKTVEGSVQWGDDQVVTLTISFGQKLPVDRVVLRQWFGARSSKGKTFMLSKAGLWASTAGKEQKLGEIADSKDRKSWGSPIPYTFGPLNAEVDALRLELTPRKGSGNYVAEIEVWATTDRLPANYPVSKEPVRDLTLADLDNDGTEEAIVCADDTVHVFRLDGSVLWKWDGGDLLDVLASADLDGDGKPEVLTGGKGRKVHCIDASGKERWSFDVPRYKRPGNVKVLFTTDLESDGKKEVIAGCDNWRFYCLNADGTERWFYESVHRSTSGMAADLDGDGKQEVALGTEYYWWHLANWKGERVWSYSTRTGPRANCLASADLDGDEKQEVIFGGADGNLHVLSGEPDSRSRGKLLWQTNLGDEVRGMQCLDIDGDGRQEILAASDSFYVFCVNGDGSIRWRKEVGDAALCLDVLADEGKSRVAVGCANGSIVVVDKKGEITGQFQASGAVRKVRFTKKGDQHLIVAVTAAGELGVFGLASIAGP